MNIIAIEDANFDLVEMKKGTPHCKKHGAMNKITKDGFWRCITVAGYRVVMVNGARGLVHRENICRAGCKQT